SARLQVGQLCRIRASQWASPRPSRSVLERESRTVAASCQGAVNRPCGGGRRASVLFELMARYCVGPAVATDWEEDGSGEIEIGRASCREGVGEGRGGGTVGRECS